MTTRNTKPLVVMMTEDIQNADEQAKIHCGTTKGSFTMHLYRAWSPHGYDRAVTLLERGFYDQSHFFRVVPDFLVQFGISYKKEKDPELVKLGQETIPDDPSIPNLSPFKVGYVSYAGSGPNSRSSQLFIAYTPAKSFGQELWETPLGMVVEGMSNVQQFYSYGDMPPWGKGPVQGKIHSGREYIDTHFPLTDSFETCSVQRIRPGSKATTADATHRELGAPLDGGARGGDAVGELTDLHHQELKQGGLQEQQKEEQRRIKIDKDSAVDQHHHHAHELNKVKDKVKERFMAKSTKTEIPDGFLLLLVAAILIVLLWILFRVLRKSKNKQASKNY